MQVEISPILIELPVFGAVTAGTLRALAAVLATLACAATTAAAWQRIRASSD